MKRRLALIVVLALTAQAGDLRIVVLQGQGAVNDIRARTAVTPFVEVRDEHDQPVAGAEVTFELPGAGPGGAFHGWMRTQTMRTDAGGKAVAAGFAPNRETGDFEIKVSAAAGPRTGAAVIAQANGGMAAREPATVVSVRRRRFPVAVVIATAATMAASIAIGRSGNRTLQRAWSISMLAAAGLLWASILLKRPKVRVTDKVATGSGELRITPLRHASLTMEAKDGVIYVDPTGEIDYKKRPRADLILITDAFADHFDAATLAQLSKLGTVVFGPPAVAQAVPKVAVIRNGEIRHWGRWTIEAVPAYNLPRGSERGEVFHPKGQGNGYVLASAGKRFYISGNTGNTPELRALRDIDVAFLSMNPPYTMPAEEAAAAALAFQPKVVYPYHYRGNILSPFQFKKAVGGAPIEVRIRDWYR